MNRRELRIRNTKLVFRPQQVDHTQPIRATSFLPGSSLRSPNFSRNLMGRVPYSYRELIDTIPPHGCPTERRWTYKSEQGE